MRERVAEAMPRYAGPLFTLAMIAATEVLHASRVDTNVAVLLFLLTLVPIAYSALKSGFAVGAASSGLLALYTLHYVGAHDVLLTTTAAAWRGMIIVLALGLAMAWSMSRIKRREDRFRDALQARARDLEARNRELTEANAALEAFGYVVSHDLKEPVRALENYLDFARAEWPGDDGKAALEKAYRANERLSRLLHGLLEYSRTSSAQTALSPVNVEALVRSDACTSQYLPRLRERGGELVVEGPIPHVSGDETLLCQIMGNVILNAVRHNPAAAGARVTLRGEERAGMVHLVVADNGPGFAPDVIDRFHGLGDHRPATIKSGFGLVIAHRAAQRLGGRIWLRNAPDGGGEVHLELPAATGGERPPRSLRESGISPAAGLHVGQPPS